MKFVKLVLVSFVFLLFNSCGNKPINSCGNTHFEEDGTPKDTYTLFSSTAPASVRLYIETSGSMNGFFRANKGNKFKKTVWSVFSGLSEKTDNNVYTLSNGGTINSPILLSNFRNKMNAGAFVSNSETHVPDILANIILELKNKDSEVAVLVSDMKYSPTGQQAIPLISQYQDEIRNLMGRNPGISVSFVCAESEYISKKGQIAENCSPYFFIIIGKSENVVAVRNDVAYWCECTSSYIESGDLSMYYQTPNYELLGIENGYPHSKYPNNVITAFDDEVSDTCTFILRVNMEGYPWGAVDSNLLVGCLEAKTMYGSSINVQLLVSDIHLVDVHNYKGTSTRKSYADYRIKVYNIALDNEVVEWTFSNKPFDGCYVKRFNDIISATTENDLTGAFSFREFIDGCFNARLNEYEEQPKRILISDGIE